MPSFVCSWTKLLIFAIQESLLGLDASAQGLVFGKQFLSYSKGMLQKLAGPWESNESPKGTENPWVERGLSVCESASLPIASLHLLKVPGYGNFFCSGNVYAKNRSSLCVHVWSCMWLGAGNSLAKLQRREKCSV